MKNYITLVFLSVIYAFLYSRIFEINNLIADSLIKYLNESKVQEITSELNFYSNLSYFFVPVILLFKSILMSSVLYIGTFFYSKVKVTFKQLWHITVKAEFIFLLVGVAKIIWFYFFETNYTLEDLQYFYPLSALNIVGYKGLDAWFIYPLQVLNLFELAYWLLLAYFIGKLAFTEKDKGKPMDLGFKIVASSYGSALLLWVVVVMFFTLNYS